MIISKWLSTTLLVLTLRLTLSSCRLYVRKNYKDLTLKEWDSIKHGINVMKERSQRNQYDPLGWYYTANIHGWPEYDGTDKANKIADRYNWHKCQHQSYYFLAWHRMYIYFFERILRRAANDPDLTLPYWNVYEPESRSLPQQFRIPADNVSNPLYVAERCKNINDGKPISERIVNPYPALATNFFTTHKQNNELNLCYSFGGGRIDEPIFLAHDEGLLERIPHDNIHLFVGGPAGYMSDLCKSSRDPVFYIHHSHTDRIWESWIAAGGRNAIEDRYLNTTFNFFDETGRLGTYRIGDFLSAKALGYEYDSLIRSAPVEPISHRVPKLYVPIDEKKGLNINYYKRFIELPMKPAWSAFFEKYVTGEFDGLDIRFTLQFDIDYLQPNIIFEIYLNLNEHTVPYDTHPNFVGTMVTFAPKCVPRLNRAKYDINKCYDISGTLYRILRNQWSVDGTVPQVFNLTFIPKFCDKTHYPQTSEDLVRFNEILMVFHRVDESYDGKRTDNKTIGLTLDSIVKKISDWDDTIAAIPGATPRPVLSETTNSMSYAMHIEHNDHGHREHTAHGDVGGS